MVTILAFLFVLGVLIFVHELGHFSVARLYGVRVLTFSLGFGPKLLKTRPHDTEYCISIIPLGGYVKLAGETVEDERTGAPDEFMSKSKWVRFQVYLAGPVMNLALALLLLTVVLVQGADVPLYQTAPAVIGRVQPRSAAEQAGLKPGDRIVRIAGREVFTWDQLDLAILPNANRELHIEVVRDGQIIDVRVTPDALTKYELGDLGIAPVLRPQFLSVNHGEPAERGGIQPGDVVLAVNGVRNLDQPAIIKLIQTSAGKPIAFTVERSGEALDLQVVPEKRGSIGMIGVSLSGYEVRRIDPTLTQAMRMSVHQNWENTVQIGRTVRGLLTAQTPVRQLMGPVAIAELSGDAARLGLVQLLSLMAMISLNLGLLNLLPVPVLDGGHIAILGFESVARRDLSDKVKERILMVGAALIVMLMVTVIYNDVMRLLK